MICVVKHSTRDQKCFSTFSCVANSWRCFLLKVFQISIKLLCILKWLCWVSNIIRASKILLETLSERFWDKIENYNKASKSFGKFLIHKSFINTEKKRNKNYANIAFNWGCTTCWACDFLEKNPNHRSKFNCIKLANISTDKNKKKVCGETYNKL